MIHAIITTADGKVERIRQSGDRLFIDHERMEVAPGEVAVHGVHSWRFNNEQFVATKISTRVTVHLERDGDQSLTFRPFGTVWLVDGLLLDGLDEEVPLATFLRDTGEWLCPRDGKRYARIVFIEAP